MTIEFTRKMTVNEQECFDIGYKVGKYDALRAQEKEPCGWCSYFAEEIQSFYVSECGDDKQHYKFCPMCGCKLPHPPKENN